MKKILACFIVLLIHGHLSAQQTGRLDPTFNPKDGGGVNGIYSFYNLKWVSKFVPLPNGRTVFGGVFNDFEGRPTKGIVCLDSTGNIDTTFHPQFDNDISDIFLQPDGKLLISGWFDTVNGVGRKKLVRLFQDGTVDPSFNPGTSANGKINVVVQQADGKILVGGDFTQFGGKTRSRMARLNENGSLDTTFNSGTVNNSVNCFFPLADGKLLVGGNFRHYNNNFNIRYLIRLNPNGTLDNSFILPFSGTACCNGVNAIVQQADQKILAAGIFSDSTNGINRSALIRILPNGDFDPAFIEPKLEGGAWSVSVQPDQKILIGGFIYEVAGVKSRYLVRLLPDGTRDPGFQISTGVNGYIYHHFSLQDGKIMIGGNFSKFGSYFRGCIARLHTDGTLDNTYNKSEGANIGVNCILRQANGKVILGGSFIEYNGEVHRGLVRILENGETDPGFQDPGIVGNVQAMALQADGKIVIGGSITSVGGQPRKYLARLDSTGALDPGFVPLINDEVKAIQVQPDGWILLGGWFDSLNAKPSKNLARISPAGVLDEAFRLKPKPDGSVYSIALKPNAGIVISGSFDSIGTIPKKFIAILNSEGDLSSGFQGITSGSGMIFKVSVRPDGKLWVSGSFSQLNGRTFRNLALLHQNGIPDTTFSPQIPANKSVDAFSALPDGRILVGQNNSGSEFGGTLVCLQSNGYADLSFNSLPTNGMIRVFHDMGNGDVLFGGSFSNLGQTSKNSIARLNMLLPQGPARNLITGTIHFSRDTNCIFNSNESPAQYHILKAEPGPSYGYSNELGKYSIRVDTGAYSVSQIINPLVGLLESQFCPDSNGSYQVDFNSSIGDTSAENNFANKVILCPLLKIQISNTRRRRCFRNKTFVQVCNIGFAPSSPQTEVKVKLPKFGNLVSASFPFTFNLQDSSYSFLTGTLQAKSCTTIQLIDSVSCISGITGMEQCTKAWVSPANSCVPPGGVWDGVDLTVSSTCSGQNPRFKILNQGQDMVSARTYKIFVDNTLALTSNFQLAANNSMTITVPLQGSHQVRLETPQSEGHPFQSFASAQIQCGQFMLNQSTISTNEDDPQMDESCANIVDSYDPNEKQVYPSGITAAGNILERRELKYTLFFQNTGSDTAYKVVLIDTLDSDFDIAEFQQGPSSHPFQLSISGKGRPVLTYTFTNINLPHKGANEEKSNGFVSFSIKPKADAAIGTRLENFADIYFDYNDPIRTNTTVNTLWRPTLVDGVLDTVFTVAARPLAHSVQTSIHPNPSKGNVEFNLAKAGTMQIFNLQGQVIETHSMGKGKNQLNLAALPKGLYLLKLQTEGSIQSQKLVLE